MNVMHGRTRKEYCAELMPHDTAPVWIPSVADFILM